MMVIKFCHIHNPNIENELKSYTAFESFTNLCN